MQVPYGVSYDHSPLSWLLHPVVHSEVFCLKLIVLNRLRLQGEKVERTAEKRP